MKLTGTMWKRSSASTFLRLHPNFLPFTSQPLGSFWHYLVMEFFETEYFPLQGRIRGTLPDISIHHPASIYPMWLSRLWFAIHASPCVAHAFNITGTDSSPAVRAPVSIMIPARTMQIEVSSVWDAMGLIRRCVVTTFSKSCLRYCNHGMLSFLFS